MLWQSILFAEGYLEKGDIDGRFGAKTDDATEKWQRAFGLTVDGWVGDGTWSAADGRLRWGQSGGGYAVYDAKAGTGYVAMCRGSSIWGTPDGGACTIDRASQSCVTFNYSSSDANNRVNFFKRTYTLV
ncbi:peptidoglycan-binding domain-containing protein [Phytomonospora sp. NPDC050363]|uniref:peptidoglycan-binding domain-containing protein n=1 Tax=Phytomonospora sp. NPDC050363 TaxID=3155642 RepID=UPI0033EA98B3